MNKKSLIKVLSILFLVVAILFSFAAPCLAANSDGFNVNFNKGDSSGASASLINIISAILNMVQIIAMGVAIIMLIVLAIKYMSAAPNDKAEIKKHAVVYIVGAVVLFGATGILQIIKNFATGNIEGAGTATQVGGSTPVQ